MSMFHGWLLKGDHPKKKRGDWITRKNQGPELEPKKARTQSNGSISEDSMTWTAKK